MEIVYKFCGKYGLDILNNCKLKVSPPSQFNDPFEFTPQMTCTNVAAYLRSERVCKWFFEIARSENGFSANFTQYQARYLKLLEANMAKTIEGMTRAMQETFPLLEKEFLDEASKLYAVLCLSERRDSLLMWGHYCDKALGLVVGFDKSSQIFRHTNGLKCVDYKKERIVFDSSWEDGSYEMTRYSEQIILSKSGEWGYEKELRQIFTLASPEIKREPIPDGSPGYFLCFPPEAVSSVTLGPRVSGEQEGKVKDVIKKPHFSHVILDRAVLNNSEFKLEFVPVK
jgi:hypothetical protein